MTKQVLSVALAATVVLGAGSLQSVFAVDPDTPTAVVSGTPTNVIGFGLSCIFGENSSSAVVAPKPQTDVAFGRDKLVGKVRGWLHAECRGELNLTPEQEEAILQKLRIAIEEGAALPGFCAIKIEIVGRNAESVTFAVVPHKAGNDFGLEMGMMRADYSLDPEKPSLVAGLQLRDLDGNSHFLVKDNVSADEVAAFVQEVPGLTDKQRECVCSSLLSMAGQVQCHGQASSLKVVFFPDLGFNCAYVFHEEGKDVRNELDDAPVDPPQG